MESHQLCQKETSGAIDGKSFFPALDNGLKAHLKASNGIPGSVSAINEPIKR